MHEDFASGCGGGCVRSPESLCPCSDLSTNAQSDGCSKTLLLSGLHSDPASRGLLLVRAGLDDVIDLEDHLGDLQMAHAA